jgi:DNA-binding FadR family transcriptional regulator
MQRITELHDRRLAQGDWPAEVPIRVKDTNIRQVLDQMMGAVGSTADHDDDDRKALKKAAEFEAKGSRFYADLARACTNPMERNFFEFLSGIEREHMLSVADSLAYLEDPEGWMMLHGRAGLDGA